LDLALKRYVIENILSFLLRSYCYYHRVIQLNNIQAIVEAMENSNKKNHRKAAELETSNKEAS